MAHRYSCWPSGTKAADREFRSALRDIARARGWRLTGDDVWRVDGPFFEDAWFALVPTQPAVDFCAYVKTLRMDDVLWDILGMSSNSDERMSLRATGAFTAGGYLTVDRETVRLESPDEAALPGLAASVADRALSATEAFLGSIGFDEDELYRRILEQGVGLTGCIASICLGDLRGAMGIAKGYREKFPDKYDGFSFRIGERSDVELVIDWCERRLAGRGEGA